MRIETHFYYDKDAALTIAQFANAHGLVMVVTERYNDISHPPLPRFYAHFKSVELMQGTGLIGIYGDGETPDDAIQNYSNRISLQILAVDSMTGHRQNIKVPLLT